MSPDLSRSETTDDVLDRAYKAAYDTQDVPAHNVRTIAIDGFRAGACVLLEHLLRQRREVTFLAVIEDAQGLLEALRDA